MPLMASTPSLSQFTSAIQLSKGAEQMYEKCASSPADTLWLQRDLANLQIAETTKDLVTLLQELTEKHLMKAMMFDNRVCWKLRKPEEALKLHGMTADERHIYSIIDEAGTTGTWVRTLRAKTGMPQNVITKKLKQLESRKLVQCIANAKYPSRKTYLLAHLTPSDEISGGAWYTEGHVDVGLVDAISNIIRLYVEKETWVKVPMGTNRAALAAKQAAIEKKKAAVQASRNGVELMDIEDVGDRLLPFPRPTTVSIPKDPSKVNFPTVGSILQYVVSTNILKNITLREEDVENLLEMMVLDGRLEKMGPTAYRTVKGAKEQDDDVTGSWNGFVDAPCGLCPVFELCGDEGEITAETCRYFAEWLGTDD